MELDQAVQLLLQATTEHRLRQESRCDSYGSSLDEPVKALGALVTALAKKAEREATEAA